MSSKISTDFIKLLIHINEWCNQNNISDKDLEQELKLSKIIFKALDSAEKWCIEKNIPKDHGIDHITQVLYHGLTAVKDLEIKIRTSILLAIIAHDLDDRKYVTNHDYEGARCMLKECDITDPDIINTVITMIRLVSCSSNGMDTDSSIPRWYYIPRSCDRLEALGYIGIRRAYETNLEFNKRGMPIPLWTDDTKLCTNLEELKKVATLDRMDKYRARGGISNSLIDHFYDKLLHIHKLNDGNSVLQDIANVRHQIMVDFILEFGQTGEINWEKWLK